MSRERRTVSRHVLRHRAARELGRLETLQRYAARRPQGHAARTLRERGVYPYDLLSVERGGVLRSRWLVTTGPGV